MKEKRLKKTILHLIYSYLLFFLLVAFLVTCTTSLFVSILANSLGIRLAEENLATAAKVTFVNVIALSFIFTTIDVIRRKLTTEKITKRITTAAKQIVKGDFDVRIAPVSHLSADGHYNEIIDCFNTMAQELSGVETLRTDFVANVSHEMKTPLAVMQNYSKLLQAEELSDEKRIEYAKGVADASRRLADMMTNILKLNRLENQQIYPQTTRFDLGEQLCECLLQYENVWEQADIALDTSIADDVIVEADGELLSLVWNNLFSNAFKFTEAGGQVSVSLTATEQYAIVRVRDTGCGMTPKVGTHIFEKFYQGDPSRAVSGNGLGLALVKRVIDIMHGQIDVESTLGKGTTFTVTMRRS